MRQHEFRHARLLLFGAAILAAACARSADKPAAADSTAKGAAASRRRVRRRQRRDHAPRRLLRDHLRRFARPRPGSRRRSKRRPVREFVERAVLSRRLRLPRIPFLIALRDTNRDGRADIIRRFGDSLANGGAGGTGIALHKGALFAESRTRSFATPWTRASRPRAGRRRRERTCRSGRSPDASVRDRQLGQLFMDVGIGDERVPDQEPHAQVARPQAVHGVRDARRHSELRCEQDGSAVLACRPLRHRNSQRRWNRVSIPGQLYSTQHGRDQLSDNWPALYTAQQGRNLPAEELLKIQKGGDYGWPECYFDSTQKKLVLAPEYGGDGGKAVGNCDKKIAPVAYFPRIGRRTASCSTTARSCRRSTRAAHSSRSTAPGIARPSRSRATGRVRPLLRWITEGRLRDLRQ